MSEIVTTRAHSTNALPRPRSALVGRDTEIESLLTRLAEVRLVTLTGPGGVGKTRLAVAVGHAVAERLTPQGVAMAERLTPQGVAMAELASVASATQVGATVRAALGVPESHGPTQTAALIERIGGSTVLLVIDNCEHLSAAAAELVDHLLDGCPRLRILATSREPLAVDGESLWPVDALECPPAAVVTANEVRATAAGRLFEQRARTVLPSFQLVDSNANAVARLCRRLGGLPLAIELAAARLRLLSVEQIVVGLEDIFGLLVGGSRNSAPRQQSLRATLDWSYTLLSDDERIVFRRLGVFPGSFGLPAARFVVTGTDIPSGAVLDLLARLVDRSLLLARPSTDQLRYRLLSPIRDFARERLDEAGERTSADAAHLAYYADLVEKAAPRLSGPQQTAALDQLELEGNNLRAGLAFAAESGAPLAGLQLAVGLTGLCSVRGYYREGRQWLDWAATATTNAPMPLRAKALLGGGSLAFLSCDYPAAIRRLEASLLLFRELGDRTGISTAMHSLGGVARERGRYARAAELYRASQQLAEDSGDSRGVAQAQNYLAFLAWLQSDWTQAITQAEQALRTFRRIDDREGIVWSLLSLGTVAQYNGEHSRAKELLGQAHEMASQLGYREGVAWSQHELGLLALREGGDQAERLLLDALAGHRRLGDRWRLASVLEDLAACSQTAGDVRRSVELLAAAAAIRSVIGTELAPCERADHERVEAAGRGQLTEEDFAGTWLHGAAATLEELTSRPDSASTPHARVLSPRRPLAHQPDGRHAADPEPVPQRLQIRTLGSCSVQRGLHLLTAADWGYGKPRELFFLLSCSAPLTKRDIGVALWPDLDGQQLRNAFHTALRDLRRAVGDPGWVVYTAGRYGLDRTRDHWSDVEIFEEALDAARRARTPTETLGHLQRAVTTYGGQFAPDLPDADWVADRRCQLAHAFEQALTRLGRLLLSESRIDEAAEVYRSAITQDPLDEGAHRQLMICLHRLGEAGHAASLYRQLVQRLDAELGVAPAPETRALYQQIRRAD